MLIKGLSFLTYLEDSIGIERENIDVFFDLGNADTVNIESLITNIFEPGGPIYYCLKTNEEYYSKEENQLRKRLCLLVKVLLFRRSH
jgi:hypothetical protein|tara:strand:- start:15241 stop:15501 length:261 start_codon:yes stop_codon:yes gene_type:complete